MSRHAVPAALMHDLLTPLHQILGFSEMLIEQVQEQGPPGFVGDLQSTHAAGKQLLALISERFQASLPQGPAAMPASGSPRVPVAEQAFTNAATGAATTGPFDDALKGSVLVVDDIDDNRQALSRRLTRQGYVAATAENGQQALDMLQASSFDIVLLDIMMPMMDGYEVLQRIKADPALCHIPVIMVSALSELDSVVRCIEMGADDYLPKPFNPILLKARIGACLGKKRAHDRETLLFAQLQENHRRVQELVNTLHTQNLEMTRWREVQDADLEVARTTQQGIVISPLPLLEGWEMETVYRPLIQVGGDVYGWRQLSEGVWLVWLADATGHGVSAALFTTLVALLFNHASAVSRTASGILSHVNAEFSNVLRSRSFMTACCAVIEAGGKLTFAGAGHPPLLIRRRDGAIERIASLNTMMGIDPAMQVQGSAATLGPGDAALLYTDGLYSLKSADGERFSIETLSEAVAANNTTGELLPGLLASLAGHSDGQVFDDDVAVIALRRK